MPKGENEAEDESSDAKELPVWMQTDRKRGILTEKDRVFLQQDAQGTADKELDKQTIRDRRYRIRQRIYNSLVDFTYIVNLDREDRLKVFERLAQEGGPSMQSMLSFLYVGITDLDYDYESDELELSRFVDALTAAIEDGERTERRFLAKTNLDLEVDRSRPPLEDVEAQLLEGHASFEEFFYFIESEGNFADMLREVIDRNEPLSVRAGSDDDERLTLIDVEQARDFLAGLEGTGASSE